MKELSAPVIARLAGGLYLLNIMAGAFAIGYVPSAIGDIANTNDVLFRAGLAAHVLVTATNVPLALIFYELFKVVNRRDAMLVVFFTITATAIEAAGITAEFTAPRPLNVQAASYSVSTVFFGFYALAIGYLIFRSTFMPRAIGVLMVIDGLAYITNSFTTILAPGFGAHLIPYIQLPILAGEGSLTVWLLIAGINVEARQRLVLETSA